jgi:uncharacterized protein YggE
MRNAIAAVMAVVAGLVVANMLGVAAAEAPTGTSVRTVSVEGVAIVPIAQGANAAGATAAYRQGMASAVSDGQSKAEFLASKAGATLGSVQSIAEGGGYISCTDESGYVEYQGEQADFGSSASTISASRVAAGTAAPTSGPPIRKPTRKHRRRSAPSAKRASAGTCTLTAQVAVVYSIS